MEQIFLTAAVLLLPMLCTTAGAAGVFLLRKTGEPATRRMLCGMAAGIMLAASVWSLLLPAIERAEQGPLPAWVPPAVGLLLGAVGLLRLETLAGRLLNAGPGRSGRMVLAVTLHNLPEGMVVGLAAALALRGEPDAISGALALALGIGLQNIPEGAAVSLPLAQEGRSKRRAFAAGAASGLVEPLGGLLALALAGWVSAAPALADEPCRRVHGLCDGTGDDPGSRGGRRTGGGHQRGGRVCPDDGAGCCPIKYSVTQKGDRAVRSPFFVCQCASSISACRVSSCSKLYSRFSASTSSFLESRGGRPSALSSWYFRSALPGVPESPQLYRSV